MTADGVTAMTIAIGQGHTYPPHNLVRPVRYLIQLGYKVRETDILFAAKRGADISVMTMLRDAFEKPQETPKTPEP
jgi:hypothetical protein